MNATETTYQPDNCLKQGFWGLYAEIFRDILRNRWLTFQIMKRDMSAMYKQSAAGLLWLIFTPLLNVGMFLILNRSGILKVGDLKVPYVIYAVLGMCSWQMFSVGLIASANSIVNAGTMISKINFSKKSLVMASMGNSLLSFLILYVVVLVLFAVYHVSPSPLIALMPLLALPMLFLSLGLGFLVSLLNAVMRDFGAMVPVMLQFVLFLTPVLYAQPKAGLMGSVTRFNPMYYLTSAPRDLAINGFTSRGEGYLISLGLSLLVFVVCISVFHLTESRVAERV